jgi:hypothetical protein
VNSPSIDTGNASFREVEAIGFEFIAVFRVKQASIALRFGIRGLWPILV